MKRAPYVWLVGGVSVLIASGSLTTQGVSTRQAHAFMQPSSEQASGCPRAMAPIPAGEYVLGEAKRHASVAGYCLDVHEVTVSDYRVCVANGGCDGEGLSPAKFSTCNWGKAGRDEHPLNCATWYQADAYCRAMRKRLPSEEEWEWAARGGVRDWTYAFGNDPNDNEAWCWRGSKVASSKWPESTCPVMQFKPNPFGVYDLSGNLWEWTSTSRADGSSLTGVKEDYYVFRGGSWGSSAVVQARADIRGGDGASWRDPDVGFRCAVSRR